MVCGAGVIVATGWAADQAASLTDRLEWRDDPGERKLIGCYGQAKPAVGSALGAQDTRSGEHVQRLGQVIPGHFHRRRDLVDPDGTFGLTPRNAEDAIDSLLSGARNPHKILEKKFWRTSCRYDKLCARGNSNINMRLLERGTRRVLGWIDATSNRLYDATWNPVHQSGTVAAAMLLALIVSGFYLLIFYRVGAPSSSVARLAADPWLGSWIRSFHRYASDLFVLAAVLHMFRMFAQGRSWGPRALTWVSGVMLFGVALICAWTGFVMAWDTFGERLAIAGGRMLDVLPIFSEPLSRIFAGDRAVPSAFFFVNMFMHIGLPLAMGAMLWLHISKVARPTVLPPKKMTWWIIGALVATSVLVPATLGPPANPFRLAQTTPTDLFAAWWLPLAERLTPVGAWGAALTIWLVLLFIPRFTRRPREGALAPSVVDPRLCTGCNQCPQDCPWGAITMVKRTDGRATLLAQVDPELCVSCGICAGSCPPMGIGPPGRSGRDQLAQVRGDTTFDRSGKSPAQVVAICCGQAPASHIRALQECGAHIHSVSCVGNLHTSVVERFLHDGAMGVIVCGCPPRDCVSREGPKWLGARMYDDREAELQERVDRRRVRIATLAPGELHESIAQFETFVRDLQLLDVPIPNPLMQLELVCDPVLFEEEV